MAHSDEEEDYMSMVFEDVPKQPQVETSIQRAARRRREERARLNSRTKAERAADAEAAREAALATALPETNKGFKMMAKLGFKQGDTLGKSESARKDPIQVVVKGDKGGIGLESDKKRKKREQWEQAGREAKRTKETEGDYLAHLRQARKDKKAETDLDNAQRTAERLSDKKAEGQNTSENIETPLEDINILWRERARNRLKEQRRQRGEITRVSRVEALVDADDDDDTKIAHSRDIVPFYTTLEDDLIDEDTELAEFKALPVLDRLHKVLIYLRDTHHYCYWCGHQYRDAEMDGCPGETGEDH
ncbi:hypothetical protein BDV95DRAFT_498095 [Massariosphaeria phaeospora]|uniref:G-patch domain-containing protein n=1 Tax=Massariosphaeria phaeospora TaxID=100035 RepID=A0A7C8I4S5_9PLEO|nr:hypothetical protein BDV95DRAFT_498095 [Massariosphaeria phaeospora]